MKRRSRTACVGHSHLPGLPAAVAGPRRRQLVRPAGTHGRQAVGVLAAETADLILLDLDMPVMDGFEFLKVLRAQAHYQTIPVIVLSARGTEEDKRRCLELGADAYLVKSAFQEADLVRAVGRYVG